MALSVVEQIAALERERARLEGHLAADENWRQLQALMDLNGATPPDGVDSEKRLRRKLAANPYYSARLKIVEAITILRRLGESAAVPDANGHDITQPAATWNRLSVPLFDEVHEPRADRRLTPLPSGEQSKTSEVPPVTAPEPTPEPAIEISATAPAPEESVQNSEPAPPASAETAAAQASLHAEAFPAAEPPAALEVAAAPAAPELFDDLTRIRGLTAVDAAGLAGMGIARFEQIAALDAEAIRDISKQLGLGKRVAKSNWIEQAADLAKDPTSAEAVANPAEPIPEPPSAASIAAASMAESMPTAQPEPTIATEPSSAPQMPEFHSLRDASAQASPRIGPARERYTPPAQLTEFQAAAPQAAAQAAPQVTPPSEPEPKPHVQTEPAVKPTPRDWLAQRRRETALAAAAAAAESLPPQPPSSPPPIPAATHHQPPVQPARISISTPEMAPPEEAEVVITSGASAPEGRKLLVASAGALRSLRDRLLGASSPTGPEMVDPRAGYANEEADIEIVGGHAPPPPSASGSAELQDQPTSDAPPAKVAGRLSQMLGALRKRG